MNHRVSLRRRNPKGRIHQPRNRASVPRLFRVEGTVDSLPADQHLLLVVEIGGLKWPKGESQVTDTSWSSDVYEGGTPPAGNFALSLYAVSSEGHDAVTAWLEHGKATGSYPGLVHIKDGIKLDSINLRLELS